jgi:hypothetical protein
MNEHIDEMQRALDADGEKLRQLTGRDHGPFELSDVIDHLRAQSIAILIAVEIAKQGNEVDNLGDGESVVLMGKHPTINVMQLAEKIVEFDDTKTAALQRRIDELTAEVDRTSTL